MINNLYVLIVHFILNVHCGYSYDFSYVSYVSYWTYWTYWTYKADNNVSNCSFIVIYERHLIISTYYDNLLVIYS